MFLIIFNIVPFPFSCLRYAVYPAHTSFPRHGLVPREVISAEELSGLGCSQLNGNVVAPKIGWKSLPLCLWPRSLVASLSSRLLVLASSFSFCSSLFFARTLRFSCLRFFYHGYRFLTFLWLTLPGFPGSSETPRESSSSKSSTAL